MTEYKGLSASAFAFMQELKANNNTLWFQEHRERWEALKEELRTLCRALTPFIHDLDPELETEPKSSRCLGRINRDTRFSKDKSPYRDFIDLLFFPRDFGRSKAPGLAVGITAENCYIGTWLGASMESWRERLGANIAAKSDIFQQYLEENANFSDMWIDSQSYAKTRVKGLPPLAHQWAQRKFYYMGRLVPGEQAVPMGASLFQEIQNTFLRLLTLLNFATSQHLAADLERFRKKLPSKGDHRTK